ncbi:hypothetical protein TrST_g5724 [Triparma strigata]|uniref:PX domain-containing protein n=1 Tax=Triparma strigata TaxID=1606541 RepID=A0A9W7ASM9_9STRA|nr:hypothetical protein TrST_g5724 [Triparma strigata]
MRHSSCSEVGSAVSQFVDEDSKTKEVRSSSDNPPDNKPRSPLSKPISPPLPPHALFAPDTRFSATSQNTSNTNSSKTSVKSAEMLSREASEAVFSRVESLAILSGRYYNPRAKTNSTSKSSSSPSPRLFDKGYVVYEVYVKANYTDYGWNCHRRYNNFLELDSDLPPVTKEEIAGCVWEEEDDVDFDYRKGKPTAFVSEVEAEENDDDNQDPNTSRRSSVVRKNTKNTYPPRPKLPPKVYVGNFSEEFIERRRIDLAKYLRYLYLNPYTRSCAPFLSFIAAERIIDHFQSFSPDSGRIFQTPKNNKSQSKVDFFHTPEFNDESRNQNTLTSFPYAFRSTRGGLDSYVGWDSERKKRKKKESDGGGCSIL